MTHSLDSNTFFLGVTSARVSLEFFLNLSSFFDEVIFYISSYFLWPIKNSRTEEEGINIILPISGFCVAEREAYC